ncbi:hypothetical protein GCM10007415_16190 [Parapedobacter pyrenivorans]|uniref:Uncharacterized protein n=1 Tax=Parapedobacter pyrenivorans TaxID=1305674 RepID=A0A917M841_9SPHI|nr:hypothetical protein GCM10007415_16190 [Parapedobacter pyrenivorans]
MYICAYIQMYRFVSKYQIILKVTRLNPSLTHIAKADGLDMELDSRARAEDRHELSSVCPK